MKRNKTEGDPVYKMTQRSGVSDGWILYKGTHVFAQINYERSKKANRPMYDISYCATKALNGIVLFCCQYNKKHFKKATPCPLTNT